MEEMKDKSNEMPADFDNEIHKWSLECKFSMVFLFARNKFSFSFKALALYLWMYGLDA